ncbi:MAG: hypothetical protein PF484_03260 [Bacteroidales bacterium]|jgi:hypothetical protein|nr:hypothetical protein [Bacteroidales bacterium]
MKNEEKQQDKVKKTAPNKAKKTVQKRAKETKEKVDEKTAQIKEKVQDQATDSKEKVSSKASEKQDDKTKESAFWDEAKENVTEGAKIFGDEAIHLGKKLASYSESIFGKIKDNTKDAFKYGLDLTNEGVQRAQEMAEHLKDDFEIRKLNNKKKEVSTQLGIKFYLEIKNNNNEIPDNLLKNNEVLSLLKELEDFDKEILKRSEETEK